MKQSTSLLLLAIFLLQSCVAYQKTSVSLKEAENKGKAKVEFTPKRSGILAEESTRSPKNIILEDGTYYLVYGSRKTPVDTASIQSIYLKDSKKSKRQTIAAIIVPIVLIPVGFVLFLALLPVE